MRIITPLLLVMLLLQSVCGMAQKAMFEFYTVANGLSGNNTSSVAQDKQGFIWFLNDGKIHRFDGHNFLTTHPPIGSPANREPFLGLASWQDSLLFVWSEKAAFLFSPQTGNWQNINIKEANTANHEMLFWQRMGKDNILLNRTNRRYREATIWHFQNNQLAPVLLPKHIATFSIPYYWYDISASGRSYLAYRDTLFSLNLSGNILTAAPLHNICTDCYDLCFQFEPNGTPLLLANWRFFRLNKEKTGFEPHPANRFLQAGQNHLHRFIMEKNGSFWACGQDRNLVYYDAAEDTLYNFHNEMKALLPNPNDFKDIFQDNTGIVWVTTRLGLLKVRPQMYSFDTYFSGMNNTSAYYSFRGFSEDAQGMMYGVFYDGIAKFDPAKKQTPKIYTFSNILNFFDLYPEGDHIWVNSGQLFNPASGELINIPGLFHENPVGDNGFFSKDKNGTLWWASHYQLYRLQKSENGTFQWIPTLELPEKIFNKTEALHAGLKSGKLWISFKGKLLEYEPETGNQCWYDLEKRGLPVTRIMVIEEDRSGNLWLGTDAGLLHFNPANNSFKQYTVNEGLPNNFVCGLLTEADTCLWLSTNHGLSRFHIPNETFINFYEEDGLSSNEFNRKSYFKARNGRMFFGSIRGITAFFPNEVVGAYHNMNLGSKMVLSSFEYTDERRDTIFRQTQFAGSPEIHLYHWTWSYTFEFALTDFGNPEEIYYSYQMEGYKNSWSAPSKFNFTRFNSLPNGEYTFRVKARDSRGQWHPNQLAVKVVMHPPWWTTWWAWLVYVLILGVVLHFISRYELNRQALKAGMELRKMEAEKLKELDSFKSRLYTNLTHEFRTPLTVILGMTNQLAAGSWQHAVSDKEKERIAESLKLIKNNGQSLLQLINQLLDLSKLENKSFILNLQQSNIVPYLRYVTESFQSFAYSKNLSLSFFTTLEELLMDYDPEEIKQVLTNLISNAIKFTPSGGKVSVVLEMQNKERGITDPAKSSLVLSVTDTGIGIAEKDLPHIFNRSYQVDNSSTRKQGGTGIGLAFTQELVKLMNGNIFVESEMGQGTTFRVVLPITNNAVLKKENETVNIWNDINPVSILNQSGQDHSSIPDSQLPTLLIIEDNPDVVTYLKACLAGLYQPHVAYNGKTGIEIALEIIPDIIISDVMMPEKDGYQVCDTLKNDERTSHIPIILLTAKADAASKIAGLRRGADAYLSKPFDKEELLVRLEALVARQKRMVAYFSKKIQTNSPHNLPETFVEETILVEDAFIQKVRNIVAENFSDENFGLPQLCQMIGMSRSQLFRKMSALIGTSPSDFIRSYRLNQAKALLETTDLIVSEVAWKVGFKDPSHFSKSFHEAFGFSPSATNK